MNKEVSSSGNNYYHYDILDPFTFPFDEILTYNKKLANAISTSSSETARGFNLMNVRVTKLRNSPIYTIHIFTFVGHHR